MNAALRTPALFLLAILLTGGVPGLAEELFYNLKQEHAQSVLFVRVADQKALYSIEPQRLLNPASVSKLATSAALLKILGPKHKFKTEFYARGKRTGNRIAGDLICVGAGDPFLVNEKLWEFAADLKAMGINEISGDIVIDNSLFDDETRSGIRNGGERQSSRAYDAPITPFGINFNTYSVAVSPALDGGKALMTHYPYLLESVKLKNNIKTVPGRQSTALQITRTTDDSTEIIGSGKIGATAPLTKIYRSIGDPVQSNGEILKSFLKEAGISVKGGVKSGQKRESDTYVHSITSYDLGFIVSGLNHFSNNYIADVLVKRLGATLGSGKPGTTAGGLEAIRSFLTNDVGIRSKFVLNNGSGLTEENRLSAEQIVQILVYATKRFDFFPEFINGLASGGEEGTLERRFKKDMLNLATLVRAKTGTLSEPVAVSGLAGYLNHPKHGLVAFAILENGIPKRSQPSIFDFRERQDHAIKKFIETF
ncbi:MAG: D-alanyl-D-alanine carboxypeptidase/D-alanyl-D-alanine-endopeptidase [Oligoflexales bacterium]